MFVTYTVYERVKLITVTLPSHLYDFYIFHSFKKIWPICFLVIFQGSTKDWRSVKFNQLGLGILRSSIKKEKTFNFIIKAVLSISSSWLLSSLLLWLSSQQTSKLTIKVTCSNLTIKILEKGMNLFKVNNKDTRTTSLTSS